VSANKGDLINNKQALATLITLTRIVTGKISEENFADVQVGQKARVNFLGYHDEMFDATVSRKLPTAEESTQRYLVYLDVAIAPERLLPNLTGKVAVVVGEHAAKALVPRRAIFDGAFVYVVDGGRVVKRKVELGYTSLTVTEVTNGLEAGDQVILDNLDQFAEGDRVRVELSK
jgi:RND family efflux transporter MFP subunit